MEVAGRLGLRLAPIRLTPHPMPVDGLVVGQTPAPGERLHRDRTLTVQVWHPSEPDGRSLQPIDPSLSAQTYAAYNDPAAGSLILPRLHI